MLLRKKSIIIDRIKTKARMIKDGDESHKKIKLALIVGGGGMRGVYGIGALRGLENLGLTNVFDFIVGSSAGACDSAYFLSHQSDLGVSIYCNDLTDERFIKYTRLSKIVDIDYLERLFRTTRKLKINTIKKAQSNFYVTVTTLNGNKKLINVKTSKDIVKTLKASSALPIGYNHKVKLGHHNYIDGGLSIPIPIEETIKKFKPTDILIVLNEVFDHQNINISVLEKILSKIYLRKFPKNLKEKFLAMNKVYNKEVDEINHLVDLKSLNIGVIAPIKQELGLLTQNKNTLKRVADNATKRIEYLFK